LEFASEGFDAFLVFEAQEGFQAEFDGFAFGFESGSVEDVLDEVVIDDDIGSHGSGVNVYDAEI
jgi:hypothetical protein